MYLRSVGICFGDYFISSAGTLTKPTFRTKEFWSNFQFAEYINADQFETIYSKETIERIISPSFLFNYFSHIEFWNMFINLCSANEKLVVHVDEKKILGVKPSDQVTECAIDIIGFSLFFDRHRAWNTDSAIIRTWATPVYWPKQK